MTAAGSTLGSDYLDPAVLEEVGGLEIIARGAVEGMRIGRHRSLLAGLSTNFTHHRPYVPGDELRHIDWRVYGRNERYYIKKFEAETNFESYLLLDASASMRFKGSAGISKLEYAKRLVATMAYRITDDRDSAGLAVFDDKLRGMVPPRGSKSVLIDLVRMLSETKGETRTDVGAVLTEMAGRMRRRGFVMLFSDLLTDEQAFIDGLHQLVCAGQNVIVFQVLDNDELTFPFDGAMRFVGMEDDLELIADPDRIRAAYLEELQAMIDRYRLALGNIGVDHVLVNTSEPIGPMVAAYLAARADQRGGQR